MPELKYRRDIFQYVTREEYERILAGIYRSLDCPLVEAIQMAKARIAQIEKS